MHSFFYSLFFSWKSAPLAPSFLMPYLSLPTFQIVILYQLFQFYITRVQRLSGNERIMFTWKGHVIRKTRSNPSERVLFFCCCGWSFGGFFEQSCEHASTFVSSVIKIWSPPLHTPSHTAVWWGRKTYPTKKHALIKFHVGPSEDISECTYVSLSLRGTGIRV